VKLIIQSFNLLINIYNKKMKKIIIIFNLFLYMLLCTNIFAGIYECKTPEGKTFYSNSPCGNKVEMKEINVQKFEKSQSQENKSESNYEKKSYKDKSSLSASNTENCPCGSGIICAGKKGGKYCITSSGKKKYNP